MKQADVECEGRSTLHTKRKITLAETGEAVSFPSPCSAGRRLLRVGMKKTSMITLSPLTNTLPIAQHHGFRNVPETPQPISDYFRRITRIVPL